MGELGGWVGGWAVRRLGGWLLVVGLLLFALFVLQGRNDKAIERAQAEAADLADQRDSLVSVVQGHEQEQAALIVVRDSTEALARNLRDSVVALERSRSAAQLTVRQIRTVGKLQTRLRAAFPELGKSGWGLTTIPVDQRDTIGIQYLLVPAWFSETFVIDHANAKSWRAQKDKLLAVDSLQLTISALQDSVTTLVAANADAYRTGYQAAYDSYQDLSKRYVAELKKPRLSLGLPIGFIVAAGAGVLVAELIHP